MQTSPTYIPFTSPHYCYRLTLPWYTCESEETNTGTWLLSKHQDFIQILLYFKLGPFSLPPSSPWHNITQTCHSFSVFVFRYLDSFEKHWSGALSNVFNLHLFGFSFLMSRQKLQVLRKNTECHSHHVLSGDICYQRLVTRDVNLDTQWRYLGQLIHWSCSFCMLYTLFFVS